MIKRKDIEFEFAEAQKKVKTDGEKALLKILEVIIKLLIGTRTNTVRIMEKLGVPKVTNEKHEENNKAEKELR